MMSLLDFYGREAAMYVQASRLKIAALFLRTVLNSRPPEALLVDFFIGRLKMKFLRTPLIGITVLSLAACTTTSAQQTYNSGEQTLSNIGAEMKSCTSAAWNFAPELKNILSLEDSQNPQKVRNNKSYIRQDHKKSMSSLADKMNQCREHGQEKIENSPDYYVRSFAPISQESIDLRNDIFQRYLSGKIPSGAAASSLENVHKYLIARWEDQQQKMVGQLNQQHFQEKQAQAAMWQAIGAEFENHNNRQQQYNQRQQVNKPVHTQCHWNGGIMVCSSY
jgi:hypothetical protein